MEAFFPERLRDLSEQSIRQSRFTFTGFLTPEEISELQRRRKTLAPFTLFGGAPGTERCIARFGSEEEMGYSVPFPIVCLKISPLSERFSDALTHRDFLGALMHTGIERDRVGDVVVRVNTAYVFAHETIAPFLAENVTRVKNTAVSAGICDEIPEGALFTTVPFEGIAASDRLDCIVGAVHRLSRGAAAELFREQKIFVNGAVCENLSYSVKPGDVISVRGKGKFVFTGIQGSTKKGRAVFTAEIYR